jgi:hypothetical protein
VPKTLSNSQIMVMMQSPTLSDSGPPESPTSNHPDSPNNNNNISTPNNELRLSGTDEMMKDIKPKLSVLTAINKENSSSALGRNNNLDQILYPKTIERDLLEPSAKFSIERLKQLADQRLSPSNIENSGFNYKHQIIQSGLTLELSSHHHAVFSNHPPPPTPHHLNILSHNNHMNNLKFGLLPSAMANGGGGGGSGGAHNNSNNNNNVNELDIERIKLARTLSNGKDLSDFGFRIQLGGLTSNYEHSETHSDSEELNVDGNEDSSQDENSVSCIIKSRLIYYTYTVVTAVCTPFSTLSHNQFNPTIS